jgi:hypothetical protein
MRKQTLRSESKVANEMEIALPRRKFVTRPHFRRKVSDAGRSGGSFDTAIMTSTLSLSALHRSGQMCDSESRSRSIFCGRSHVIFKGANKTIVVLSTHRVASRFRDIRDVFHVPLVVTISLGVKSLPPLLLPMPRGFCKGSKLCQLRDEVL